MAIKKWLVGIAIGLVVIVGGHYLLQCLVVTCFMRSHKMTADEVFRKFLTDPIPINVKIIEGGGTWWQGYSATLVFTTDKDTFNTLSLEYEVIPMKKAQLYFQYEFKKYTADLPNLICYYKRTDIKRGGDLYLFWDEKNGKVFFYGREG